MPWPEIVIGARHWISEKLFARWQTERHEVEQCAVHIWRKCLFADQCAPGTVAGIAWRHMRKTLLTHRRTDAVCTDQQIRVDDFAIGKMRADFILVLLKFREAPPAVIMIGCK